MKGALLHVFTIAMLVATPALGQEILVTKDFLTESGPWLASFMTTCAVSTGSFEPNAQMCKSWTVATPGCASIMSRTVSMFIPFGTPCMST